MAKATLFPSKITQPNAHEKISIKKWCFKEVRRGGHVYSLGCSSPNDPRYYHEWTNVDELKEGGTAQCGRPSTRSCTHKIEYGIAGYRNTCPIAGCNGTYNTPATLRLYLSAKDLANKGIKTGAKINKVTISFQHRCTGVDVSNGKESTSWGPNFYGYSKYPSLKVLQLFFTNSSYNRISKIVTTNSNGNDFNNPPLSKSYGTVTATFDDITFDELKGGALNIVYGRNLSTNPGNIYIKNIKIEVDYTDMEPAIEGNANSNSLLTSNEIKCCTKIQHTITAGYKQKNKWITSNAPKSFSKNDIIINAPKGVTVTLNKVNNLNFTYDIIDNSNISGKKYITYTIKGTKQSIQLYYTATKRPKPSIQINSSFKQFLRPEDILLSSFVVQNGCTSDIKIYADSLTNQIAHIKGTDICYDCTNGNILKEPIIKNIVETISNLPCGSHTLYFKRNNESTASMITKTVTIKPRQYTFKMYIDTENEQEFHFLQDKTNYQKIIHIVRTDKENPSIVPKFKITENTLLKNRVPNSYETEAFEFPLNTIKEIPISVYLPGVFSIAIKEVNNSNIQCSLAQDIRTINVEANHKQNHDILFIRGEDSTSFDYDYLVAWEGDDIKQPIDVNDIELICSYDDIRVCADELATTGLSQTGISRIRVVNQSPQELDLKNIKIELNILSEDEDGNLSVTTDDYFELDGMFLNLENNFKMYNKDLADNISLENLSPDEDMEDEENVYIHIKELKYGDSIIINLPFESRAAKDIYCQLLIFGEPIELHSFDNCYSDPFDYMQLNTYDSILTDMQIIGETDILSPNIDYNILTGEEENQCPNECYNTKTNQNLPWQINNNAFNGGITYRIQNIDSSNCEAAQTIIKNDMNLIPVSIVYYTYEENIKTPHSIIIDENYQPNSISDKVYWEMKEFSKPQNIVNAIVKMYVKFPNADEQLLIQRTNKNGEVKFVIQIPEHANRRYTIEELLSQVVCFEYEGNNENKGSTLGTLNQTIIDRQTNEQNSIINRIKELQTLQADLPEDSRQYLLIQDAIDVLENNKKNQTYLTNTNSYRRYKPGDSVTFNIRLQSNIKYIDNHIVFNPEILYSGEKDEITVLYKICNLENNQGILNTSFETDTYMLIPNKISKDIYCGVETQLHSKASIEKKIVEKNTLNVIHIFIYNDLRDNHDIVCKIDLGPYAEQDLQGIYEFININIDDGDYNLNKTEDNRAIIEWNIGEMSADTQTKAIVTIKGKEVGLSEILIDTYDYLHNENQTKDYHFNEYNCDCRGE